MQINRALILGLIETCREVIASHADDLCELDRAIGDGDHGTNMRRGCEAVYLDRERLGALPLPQAIETIGTMLVMSVGGASGPLYGTLLIEIGRGSAPGKTAQISPILLERQSMQWQSAAALKQGTRHCSTCFTLSTAKW